jgi:hypothetical protein
MAWPYFRLAYRIRAWGRLPKKRGATLVICNHQHDLDTTAVITRLILDGPWFEPVYSAGSRRMFEPGFMGFRTRWLRSLLRRADWSGLFGALGVLPIENELRRRTLASFAAAVERKHGDLVLEDVFDAYALAPLGDGIARRRISFLADSSVFVTARNAPTMIEYVRQPYRDEILAQMRVDLDSDLARIERTLASGKTFYLTPEGRYSIDGRMSRVRTTLRRLAPLATVYLSAVSYDAFVGRRLSMLFHIVLPADASHLGLSLAAARPVTTSQLIADWLVKSPAVIDVAAAARAVSERLAALPPSAFVDPELRRRPAAMARAALEGLIRLRILKSSYALTPNRRHPQFPGVPDIVAHQANQFAETLAALRELHVGAEEGRGVS